MGNVIGRICSGQSNPLVSLNDTYQRLRCDLQRVTGYLFAGAYIETHKVRFHVVAKVNQSHKHTKVSSYGQITLLLNSLLG